MIPMQFSSATDSHLHSLTVLETLSRYDDFMLSIDNLLDVGCGSGLDLEWWASRTTRDEIPEDLKIKCSGIDLATSMKLLQKYKIQEDIKYIEYDMEDYRVQEKLGNRFDVIWCHDVFQFAINPLGTLSNFYNLLSKDGMLALMIPQSTNVVYHKQEFNQFDGVMYNHTIVSLIHMLAISGFDCSIGFFNKRPEDPWLSAVVYKSEHKPMDPRTTRWYDLVDLNILPKSAAAGVKKAGHLRQRDLVLPWLDKSLIDYSQQ